MSDQITNHRDMTVRELRDQLGRRIDKAFFASESTIVTKNGEARAALIPIAELERLRKLEAAARVVLHFTKDARIGPDGEDAVDDLAALVPVTVAEDNTPTTEEKK